MKTNTNISTDMGTTSYTQTPSPNIQDGWRCPRCGRINAPWVRQCDCSPSTSTWDKITVNPCDDWWKNSVDTFRIHPETITYTNVNQVVGGSDYKDSVTGDWVNVPKTYTNSVKENQHE